MTTGETALSAAITAQMLEISSSNNAYPFRHSDFRFALQLLQEELRGLQQIEADARVAQNFRQSLNLDSPIMEEEPLLSCSVEEEQVWSDRLLAERLAQGEEIPSMRGLPEQKVLIKTEKNISRATSISPTRPSKEPIARSVRGESIDPEPFFGSSQESSVPTAGTSKPKKSPPQHEIKVTKKRKVESPRKSGSESNPKKKAKDKGKGPEINFQQELEQLEDLLKVLATSINWSQGMEDDGPSTSSRDAAKPYREELAVICTICGDTTQNYRVFSLSCGHRYCIECMREHIMMTVNKKSSYPPRCCEPLPITFATEVLQESELETLLDMRDLSASSKHIACAHCNIEIIHGTVQAASAYCIRCQKFTCTHCKQPLHKGLCPEDKDTASLLETAQQEGWSKCSRCNNMVELSVGCYHMTCRCGYEFCYLCEEKYGSCKCPKSSENSVMGRLRERTGKEARNMLKRWAFSKSQMYDEVQLDEYKTLAMDSHRKNMELRTSLQQIRAEKEDERQTAEQIVLLRSQIQELKGDLDVAAMRKNKKDAESRKRIVEVRQGMNVGEEVVAGILVNMEKERTSSRKGKERARDANADESIKILGKIMAYART